MTDTINSMFPLGVRKCASQSLSILLLLYSLVFISGCTTFTINETYEVSRDCNCTPAYITFTPSISKNWSYHYDCINNTLILDTYIETNTPLKSLTYYDYCGEVKLI
jgi:hypothetical protein